MRNFETTTTPKAKSQEDYTWIYPAGANETWAKGAYAKGSYAVGCWEGGREEGGWHVRSCPHNKPTNEMPHPTTRGCQMSSFNTRWPSKCSTVK